MIITGGSLRGRKLQVLAGERTRPTAARVKEAVFSILGDRLNDARVLDLFAGSGALGFEAVSRGAQSAVFVEMHAATARAIAASAERFAISASCTVLNVPVERSLSRLRGRFKLVFADPPYAYEAPLAFFASLVTDGFLDDDGIIAYEHAAEQASAALPPELELWRESQWGSAGFWFLRKAHRQGVKNGDPL